jgi:hypothetical protein
MLLHTFCNDELSEVDAAVPTGVFDARGNLSDAYKTGQDTRSRVNVAGVCVMRTYNTITSSLTWSLRPKRALGACCPLTLALSVLL